MPERLPTPSDVGLIAPGTVAGQSAPGIPFGTAGRPRPVATGPRRGPLRSRVLRLVSLLTLIGLTFVLAHRPLLTGFALLFRVDNPAPSDAIVLLLGDFDDRPAKALELYRKGIAPVVLMCESEDLPVLEVNGTEQIRKYFIRNGVPPEAIRVLPGGEVGSTFDEAMRVRDYTRSRPVRRITLVTTAFHTARARWVFRKVLRGKEIDIRVAAARRPQYDERNWYRTEKGLVDYFEESIKTLYYHIAH